MRLGYKSDDGENCRLGKYLQKNVFIDFQIIFCFPALMWVWGSYEGGI